MVELLQTVVDVLEMVAVKHAADCPCLCVVEYQQVEVQILFGELYD